MNSINKIPWWNPKIGPLEQQAVIDVLNSEYLNEGSVTQSFEIKVAELTGARHAIASTSGTTAIFMALKSMGIGAGDEVLVPDLTFIATANAVTLTGAKVILVDVREEDLTIDLAAAEKSFTPKTKAIIPVHVTGRPAKIEAILDWAQKKRLLVVEDAAECWGARHNKRHLGTFGNCGVLSLSPNKTVSTGQGGFVLTNDDLLAEKLRAIKDQGRAKKGTGGDDHHPVLGFNFKLTNLQSAVGLAQLNYLNDRIARLRQHYLDYQNALCDIRQIRLLPFDIAGENTPQWIDAIVESRDGLVTYLKQFGIDCRKFWFPLHTQHPYAAHGSGFPTASALAPKALWLPSAYTLTTNDIHYVCSKIKEFFVVESKSANR